MKDVVKKLLVNYSYSRLETPNENQVWAFANKDTDDCIVVAEYRQDEIEDFSILDTTKLVDSVYQSVSDNKNLSKDTSLVALIKVKGYGSYNSIKNQILKIEENPYSYRKYVIVYTEEGLSHLSNQDDLAVFIKNTISDESLFKDFEEKKEKDFYRLVLDLYIKLPFLKMDSAEGMSIREFDDPSLKESNKSIASIIEDLSGVGLENTEDIDYVVTDSEWMANDKSIEGILSLESVKGLLNED